MVQKVNLVIQDIHVVGDKFINFANKHENVCVFSEFLLLLSNKIVCVTKVILGQGLSNEERSVIKLLSMHDGMLVDNDLEIEFASLRDTHKHNVSNILISDPVRLTNGNVFSAHLLINDDCIEMSDHTTGEHIQGMILIEAARQMTIAVTEKFFIRNLGQVGFTTDGMETEFIRYVFPIPCVMNYVVQSHRGIDNNNRFKVLIEFHQYDELCAKVVYEFSTFSNNLLKQVELDLAEERMQKSRQQNI